MQETWFRSLGCVDSLEKEMSTHSSILAWEIPWTEEPGGLQTMGVAKCRIQLRLTLPDPTVLEWLIKPQFSSVQSLSRVRLFATP